MRIRISSIIVLVVIFAVAVSAQHKIPSNARVVTEKKVHPLSEGVYFVKFKKSVKSLPEQAKGLAVRHGFSVRKNFTDGFSTKLTQAQVTKLSVEGMVEYVESLEGLVESYADPCGGVTYMDYPEYTPVGILAVKAQSHPNYYLPKFWQVAVVDVGAEPNDVNIVEHINTTGVPIDTTGTSPPLYYDPHGHGTQCASIIAAKANGFSLVGVWPGGDVIDCRVLDKGVGTWEWVRAGLDTLLIKAMMPGSRLVAINMSLGGWGDLQSIRDAVDALARVGVVVVCAAGNGMNDAGENMPVRYPSTIGVGGLVVLSPGLNTLQCNAHGKDGTRASFSSFGQRVDISGPASDVLANIWWTGYTFCNSGTSFSAPHVTGVVALICEQYGRAYDSLGVESIRARLKSMGMPQQYWANGGFCEFDGYPEPFVQAVPFVPYEIDTCETKYDTLYVTQTVHDTVTITTVIRDTIYAPPGKGKK